MDDARTLFMLRLLQPPPENPEIERLDRIASLLEKMAKDSSVTVHAPRISPS